MIRSLACCLYLLLLLLVPFVASAETLELSVVDVEYATVNGQQAINIVFSQPIKYTSHFPTGQGRQLTILLDVIGLQTENIAVTQQNLMAPPSETMPLKYLLFSMEDLQPTVVLRFNHSVLFNVLQSQGQSTLTVVVPTQDKAGGDRLSQLVTTTETVSPAVNDKTGRIFQEGRDQLKQGNFKQAIMVFSKVLSLPSNTYSQAALELLGVARERNKQFAQAKLIFKQYITQYPKGEDTVRVKQRLAELMSGEIKPQSKLKIAKSSSGRSGRRSEQKSGAISQTYFYGKNTIEGSSSNTDTDFVSTQISANWRVRENGKDSRAFFFGTHEYNRLKTDGSEFKISSLYYKYKDTDTGYYLTAGRQSSSAAGVLGRFDGLYLGYAFEPTMKVTLSMGSPVLTTRKDRVQREKIFQSVSLEFDNFLKDWFIAPYILSQKVDGIQDRQTIGAEARYFGQRTNIFGLLDYDSSYSEINIFSLRAQIRSNDKLSLNFLLDRRKIPLLETSNALIGQLDINSVDDLLKTQSEDDIRKRALANTGDSTLTSIGMSNTINNRWQVSGDLSAALYNSKFVDISGNSLTDETDQFILSFRSMVRKVFQENDGSIFELRYTNSNTKPGLVSVASSGYTETIVALSHRLLDRILRVNFGAKYTNRDEDSGINSIKIKPYVKLDYRKYKNVNVLFNVSYETERSTGSMTKQNYRRWDFDLGYRWDF